MCPEGTSGLRLVKYFRSERLSPEKRKYFIPELEQLLHIEKDLEGDDWERFLDVTVEKADIRMDVSNLLPDWATSFSLENSKQTHSIDG